MANSRADPQSDCSRFRMRKLANLFLHYAFDQWMARQHPDLPFERYAGDAIVHCRTREEAERLREEITRRCLHRPCVRRVHTFPQALAST